MESLSAAGGRRVTNHLPTRPEKQRQICRAINIARATTTSLRAHNTAYDMPSTGRRTSKFKTLRAGANHQNKARTYIARHQRVGQTSHQNLASNPLRSSRARTALIPSSWSIFKILRAGASHQNNACVFYASHGLKGWYQGAFFQLPGCRRQPTISKPKPRVPIAT